MEIKNNNKDFFFKYSNYLFMCVFYGILFLVINWKKKYNKFF